MLTNGVPQVRRQSWKSYSRIPSFHVPFLKEIVNGRGLSEIRPHISLQLRARSPWVPWDTLAGLWAERVRSRTRYQLRHKRIRDERADTAAQRKKGEIQASFKRYPFDDSTSCERTVGLRFISPNSYCPLIKESYFILFLHAFGPFITSYNVFITLGNSVRSGWLDRVTEQ